MFLDGIRTDRGMLSELPARALTGDEAHAVITGTKDDRGTADQNPATPRRGTRAPKR
jgi:hypothetical protein